MPSDYAKFKISCWAVVNGTEIDVVQIAIEYTLNGIPSATMTLALGNNAVTNAQSTAATLFEDNLFSFRSPISVYASMEQQDAVNTVRGNEIVKEFESTKIFEGYITGFGYQRSGAASVLSVSAEHWLSDLTASTMISASTHSMMPGDLQAAILRQSFVPGSRAAAGLMSSSWIHKLPSATEDLWENGIKVILESGTNSNALIQVDMGLAGGCDGSPYNKAAADALGRIDGRLKLKVDSGSNVQNAISADLAALFLDNFVGQTMWDNLISASANYMFAVAPQVNSASVITFLPSISGTPFKSIGADQIYSVAISGDMPRTIRGVGILFFEQGALINGRNDTRVDPTPGRYIAESTCKGTLLFKQAPPWLSVGAPVGLSDGADKIKSTQQGISTSVNPPGGVASDKPPPSANVNTLANLRNDYAKSVYGYEVLKGRQGTISGPLRLDIGVGSYIEFEIPENLHQESNPKYFRGIVVKVELSINAQSATAGTTYTVAYVRRKDEDDEGKLTMTAHPIYSQMYPQDLGLPLVS